MEWHEIKFGAYIKRNELKPFPLVLVLMSHRTASYEKVFNYINTEILNLNGVTIMTDFESAMRNALRNIAPDSWFHFCQALQNKLVSIPESFFLSDQTWKPNIL